MSENSSIQTLPWSSLSLTEPEIPWEDLRCVSDAAAQSSEVRHRLINEVDALLDRKYAGDKTSFHDLKDFAVPAIFALAAEKLDESGQQEAAKFLIHLLYRAGEADDDYLLEVGERAAGRMGLAVLEPAMDLLQKHGSKLECWFHVFALLKLAAKADTETRRKVISFCRKVIREAPDRFEQWSSIGPAAWTLADLRDVDSLPFLRTIQQSAQSPELAHAIKNLECANGGKVYPACWETPVEEWLESDVRRIRKWLEEYEASNGEDDEQDDEELEAAARFKLRQEMVHDFEASDACAALPQSIRDLAPTIADGFLSCLMEYAGSSPADMSPMDIDDVLLDFFPRKLAEDREFFQHAPAALVVFFDSLEQDGVIVDAGPLKEAVESCADEMFSLSQDPNNWGPAKSYIMAAKQDGVDPSDHAALQQYMMQYNARLATEHKRNKPARPPDDSWVRPIVRETRKIGRNDPCPCGSGKKHKKCCGR